MRSPAGQPREAARAALGAGPFLRRDRGDALFVSDAPRLRPSAEWAAALDRAGFICRADGGLLRLTPGPAWLERLEARFPEPPDAFSATLARFRGLTPEAESLVLFALACKLLDGAADDRRFDRRLRQRAAECLRLNANGEAAAPRGGHPSPSEPNSPRGGGLYACALARYIIMEAIS